MKKDSIDKQLVVEWLPSVPLINKHKAPAISCICIFYSERMERVLFVQETNNLTQLLSNSGRQQALALNLDADCRVYWLQIPSGAERHKLARQLKSQIRQEPLAA